MLEAVPAIVSYDVSVTDDPLMSQTPLTRLTENTSVTALASMGEWTYIEAGTGKSRFRGFVPTECLLGTVTDTREANRAILGSWKLYAGSSVDAEQMTFLADGSISGGIGGITGQISMTTRPSANSTFLYSNSTYGIM